MNRSGLPDDVFANVGHSWGSAACIGSSLFERSPLIPDMGLIVFIAIGLLSCVFLLFVLSQWIRKSRPKSRKRAAAKEASQSQPFLVHSRKVRELGRKAGPRKQGALRQRLPHPVGIEVRFGDSERAVYERIARYAVSGHRELGEKNE